MDLDAQSLVITVKSRNVTMLVEIVPVAVRRNIKASNAEVGYNQLAAIYLSFLYYS